MTVALKKLDQVIEDFARSAGMVGGTFKSKAPVKPQDQTHCLFLISQHADIHDPENAAQKSALETLLSLRERLHDAVTGHGMEPSGP
jgi:hypothetical protein